MAKLNYVEGDYKEALNIYARIGVDDLQLVAVPPYRLRMIAEAYSTKGMIFIVFLNNLAISFIQMRFLSVDGIQHE